MPDHLNDEERFRFRENLFSNLRMELDQLKTCQSNSVFWGIAGASAVISIIGASNINFPEFSFFFLIPLLIVYPAWMIFFDKSRTIQRLSGFLRLQEKLGAQNSERGVIGWEAALEKFWQQQENFQKKDQFIADENSAIQNYPSSRKRITSHLYHGMVFFVFFLTAVLALTLFTIRIANDLVFLFIAIAGLYLIWFTFVNYKRTYSPELMERINKTYGEKFILAIFKLYEIAEGYFLRLKNIFKKEKTNVCLSSNQPDFKRSFRDFLDGLISSLKVYITVNLIFLFTVIIAYRLYYYQNVSSVITMINLIFFSAFLAIFITILLITLYIFLNMVRGRYTINAYESRWINILDINNPV